ncbi:glycosyltransferase [Flavobacterium olei]|uniref:glycosyltransferase n=1 Tax=Flavobacterium olei TaxID=1886782 RepID=UPI00321A4523
MKILMVSMASQHFFNWVSQLEKAGHEIYWFDVLDSKEKVERLSWINQIINWKLRWDYPGRILLKSKYPVIYKFLQQFNDRNTSKVFEKKLLEVQPDLVHSFEMQVSCLPILEVMEKYSTFKWTFSSWGSDIFYSQEIGIPDLLMHKTLSRVDFLITDCVRDFIISKEKGFSNKFLGVFPGNGGVEFKNELILPLSSRKIILIKGYNNEIGKGINIIKALTVENLLLMKDYQIVIFGADMEIRNYIKDNDRFSNNSIQVYLRSEFVDNKVLIELMGKSYIYIGNSLSDGLPNSLIEAMGMGAFPIQSNPGNATAELINGKNGFLIEDALNIGEIEKLIKEALLSPKIIEEAFFFNTLIIKERYDREKNRVKVVTLYKSIEENEINSNSEKVNKCLA